MQQHIEQQLTTTYNNRSTYNPLDPRLTLAPRPTTPSICDLLYPFDISIKTFPVFEGLLLENCEK